MTTTSLTRLVPQDLQEVEIFAERIAQSALCPDNFRGKPKDVWVAIIMGLEVGLSPMQAVQNIAVINGKPCLYGDAMLAVCKNSASWEWIDEKTSPAGVAMCKVKRRGEPEVVRTFSMQDAQRAGLTGKGPWKAYPQRMLQMRARGFALRDAFPDALRGIQSAEEVADYSDVPIPAAELAGVVAAPTPLEEVAPKGLHRPAQHAPRKRGRPTNAERAARAAAVSDDESDEPAPAEEGPEEMPESFRPFVQATEPEPSDASEAYRLTVEALKTATSLGELSKAAELGLGINDEEERQDALRLYRERKEALAPAERGAVARQGLVAKIMASEEVG